MLNESLRFGMETAHWFGPKKVGGVERYAKRLMEYLAAKSYDLSVFTGSNFLDFPAGQTIIKRMEGGAVKYPVAYFQDTELLIGSLEDAVRQGSLDILEVEDFYGLRKDYRHIGRIFDLPIPLVWVIHNQGMLSAKLPYKETHPEFAADFSGRISALICKSNSIAKEAIEAGIEPTKIRVIYNAVDASVFHPVSEETKIALKNELGLPQNKKIILYVGRVSHDKGVDFLMESWPEVSRVIPETHLVIAGGVDLCKDSIAQEFAAFKNEAQKTGSASFSDGFIHDERHLAKYFQAADTFILPSQSEGLGIVLVEAMASGKPCIISELSQKHSGAGDLIIPGFNGTTFKKYTASNLIAAIKQITTDMGANGLSKYQELGFNIETIGRQHTNLYEEITHGKPYSVALSRLIIS